MAGQDLRIRHIKNCNFGRSFRRILVRIQLSFRHVWLFNCRFRCIRRLVILFQNCHFCRSYLRAERRAVITVGRLFVQRHLGQEDTVGHTAALPLLPDQAPVRQFLKAGYRLAVGNLQLPCQILARVDDVHLAVPVHPAVAAGQLVAVEQERVGHFALQTHIHVTRVAEQPPRHLHVEIGNGAGQLHQRKVRPVFCSDVLFHKAASSLSLSNSLFRSSSCWYWSIWSSVGINVV